MGHHGACHLHANLQHCSTGIDIFCQAEERSVHHFCEYKMIMYNGAIHREVGSFQKAIVTLFSIDRLDL